MLAAMMVQKPKRIGTKILRKIPQKITIKPLLRRKKKIMKFVDIILFVGFKDFQ